MFWVGWGDVPEGVVDRGGRIGYSESQVFFLKFLKKMHAKLEFACSFKYLVCVFLCMRRERGSIKINRKQNECYIFHQDKKFA